MRDSHSGLCLCCTIGIDPPRIPLAIISPVYGHEQVRAWERVSRHGKKADACSSDVLQQIEWSYGPLFPEVYSPNLCVPVECSRIEDHIMVVFPQVPLHIAYRGEIVVIASGTR